MVECWRQPWTGHTHTPLWEPENVIRKAFSEISPSSINIAHPMNEAALVCLARLITHERLSQDSWHSGEIRSLEYLRGSVRGASIPLASCFHWCDVPASIPTCLILAAGLAGLISVIDQWGPGMLSSASWAHLGHRWSWRCIHIPSLPQESLSAVAGGDPRLCQRCSG